jgi:hypothetical protein
MLNCGCKNRLAIFSLLLSVVIINPLMAQGNKNSYQYISPLPGSTLNLPETSIIIREGNKINESSIYGKNRIDVIGSKSGRHRVELKLSSDLRTLIFNPVHKFELGEEVSVFFEGKVLNENGKELLPIDFKFSISNKLLNKVNIRSFKGDSELNDFKTEGESYTRHNDIFTKPDTLPGDFPNVTVSISNDPAPGYIFLAPYNYPFYRNSFLLIIDNNGTPIFYQKSSSWNTDFTLQPKGYLSYWDQQADKFLVMDSSYSLINGFSCGNGYSTDFHEFLLLENDHSILISYDFQTVRMDTIVQGGDSSAVVIGLVIQELDSEKNVIFQWRSWDHIEITDATEDIDLTAHTIDYIHGNAIDIDGDGNLLLSSRHLDEITKINRQTGEIIWRWGGIKSRKNEFLFINDQITFSHQHDIRYTDNGTYTIYDNGNLHSPRFSRSLEYELDEIAKTATLIWKFNNEPTTYARAMGSSVKIANNSMLIGWGLHYNERSVSEIKDDGTVALELILPDTIYNYRAFKFPWKSNLFLTDPDSITFDSVLVDDSVVTTFMLLNNSSQDEFITITEFFHKDSSFKIQHEVPFVLPAQGSEQIEVRFKPSTAGFYIDTLHIRSDTDTRRIAQILILSGTADTVSENEIVYGFKLEQNYPNPFNSTAIIIYEIAELKFVTLRVYDVLGNEIATLVNEEKPPGNYKAEFDASLLPSGIYFYRIETEEFLKTKKMVLLK